MTHYLVRWEIDIEANTPNQAAIEALKIHRDPESTATVFDVYALRPQWRVDVATLEETR